MLKIEEEKAAKKRAEIEARKKAEEEAAKKAREAAKKDKDVEGDQEMKDAGGDTVKPEAVEEPDTEMKG